MMSLFVLREGVKGDALLGAVCVCVCVCACVCMCREVYCISVRYSYMLNECACTSRHTQINSFTPSTHSLTHAYNTNPCLHTFTHTHTYAHIRTHTHTYTHTNSTSAKAFPDGKGGIEARNVMRVSVTHDARVVDVFVAEKLCGALKDGIENPALIFM